MNYNVNLNPEDTFVQEPKFNKDGINNLTDIAVDLINKEKSPKKVEQLKSLLDALSNNEIFKESDLEKHGFNLSSNGGLEFLKPQKKPTIRLTDILKPEEIATISAEQKEDFLKAVNENVVSKSKFPEEFNKIEAEFDKAVKNNIKNSGPKKDEYNNKLKFLKTLNDETNDKGFASFEKELSEIQAKNGKPLFNDSQLKDIIGGLQSNIASMVTDTKVSGSELKDYYKSAKENILKKAKVEQEVSNSERKTTMDNILKFGKIGAIGVGALLLDQVLTDGKLTQSSITSIGQAAIGAFVMSKLSGKAFGETFQQILPSAIGYGAMSGMFSGKAATHQQEASFSQGR